MEKKNTRWNLVRRIERDNNRATNCHLISKPLLPPSLTLECVYNRCHRSQFSSVVTCEGGTSLHRVRRSVAALSVGSGADTRGKVNTCEACSRLLFFTLDLFRLAIEILNARQIDAEVWKRASGKYLFTYHFSIAAIKIRNSIHYSKLYAKRN